MLPKPYYESKDGRITLYCGDALEVLARLESESVDAIIVDPPYGTRTDQRDEWMVGEFSNVMPGVLPLLRRVGTKNAALYLFTSQQLMADWIMRCSPYFRMQNFLIWDKQRHSGCYGKYSWQYCWEGVYFGIKGPRSVRKYMPDILRSQERLQHPMQKPVNVLAQLIEASTDPNDLVLDCFAGTGSTLIAAKQTGRRAIGVEIDEAYCEIAVNRLAQEVLPLEAS